MQPLITIQSIGKSFVENGHHVAVLKDIDFKIHEGEFVVLLGPSGSGKSTLLRIMSGLIAPNTGTVAKDPELKQAFIFQDFALFPWLTVAENIGFGLKMNGVKKHIREQEVLRVIDLMNLHGFGHMYPRELSGGMKQRVGIARALVVKPDIIFLDEPFSALDTFTATKLRAELLNIWEQEKITIVMVTHLVEEALQLGDRIAVLAGRPAKIERIFTNTLSRPRNTRSDKFYEISDTIINAIKL